MFSLAISTASLLSPVSALSSTVVAEPLSLRDMRTLRSFSCSCEATSSGFTVSSTYHYRLVTHLKNCTG